MMAVLDPGTTVAGVLTRSKTCSAPVLWCRKNLEKGKARALVVNSGNANAFTGKKGAEATRMTAEAAAAAVGCAPDEVYVSSTGVIGEPLDASKFAHLLDGLAKAAAPDAWHEAARAIMTTDTFPKLATRTVRLGGADVVINGFAKGAGMIAPDLATMLVYIFTDAAVDQRGAAGDAGRGRGQDLQLHHHRQRHLDQRHRAAVCDRRRRGARRAGDQGCGERGRAGVRRRAARPDARAGACGW